MDNKTNCIKKGGKKPRAHLLPMMVLVLFGMIALMGVAAADNVYHGAPPVTKLSGVVNGSVWVNLSENEPWNAALSPYTSRDPQYNWGNFTLPVRPDSVDLKFARLYVVVYGGNNTATSYDPDNYYGSLSVGLKNGDTGDSIGNPLVTDQPLRLNYYKSVGANYSNDITDPLVNLSRVTSDYLAIFDITGNISGLDTTNLKVNTTTCNVSGKFDGRVKEIKLVIGWNETEAETETLTKYWINEGHDVMSKDGNGVYNVTWFNNTGINVDEENDNDNYNATLWIDYLSSPGGQGGRHWWNGAENVSALTTTQRAYSGLHNYTWNKETGVAINGMKNNNSLEYLNKTSTMYKMIVSVLAIKP